MEVRRVMGDSSSAWVKQDQGREWKKHQERLRNIKPCVDSASPATLKALQGGNSRTSNGHAPFVQAPIRRRSHHTYVEKGVIDICLSFYNPIKADAIADKLRAIETQNYRLLMRLRSIHKNYSLYSPKKHMYLLRGEACSRSTKPPRKPRKIPELGLNSNVTCRSLVSHNCKENPEDMCHRVAALSLHGDSSPSK